MCRPLLEAGALEQRLGQLLDTSGMPSVCSMIRSRISTGSVLPPAMRATRALFPLPRRLNVGGHRRLAGPGRLELGTECHNHKNRQPTDALGDPIQQIE